MISWHITRICTKVKVKVTLVQALRLCTGRTAHRGSRGIALPFHDHGTRRGERSASRPGRSLPPGKTRYPLYRRLGGPQDRSGRVRKISPPTAIRYPDRPAGSQSLYRLRYLAHRICTGLSVFCGMTTDRDSSGTIVVTGGSGFGFLWGRGFFLSSPLYPYLHWGGGGVAFIMYSRNWGLLTVV